MTADPDPLAPGSGPVSAALARTLAALPLADHDAAAAMLARRYAAVLDVADPDTMAKIGPRYLAVLAALGGTPAARTLARAAATPGGPRPPGGDRDGPDALDRLRAGYAARLAGPPPVDPTPPAADAGDE